MDRSNSGIKMIFFIIIFMLFGCKESNYEYDGKFNSKRESIGLPLLTDEWKLVKAGTGFNGRNYLIYFNKREGSWDKKSPIHFKKKVEYTSDTIVYESDTYYSGMTYWTVDGDQKIALVVNYYFVEDSNEFRVHNKGWNAYLFSSLKNSAFGEKLNKEQADSVLVSWGL